MAEKEYIEREAAIFEFETNGSNFVYGKKACNAIISRLKTIPAADVVEVVHAHWVKPTKIGWRSVDVPHCSHCKEIPCGVDMNTHYCPNCGAKMDGGADK